MRMLCLTLFTEPHIKLCRKLPAFTTIVVQIGSHPHASIHLVSWLKRRTFNTVPGKATFVSDEAASLPVKPVSWGGHLSKFWCRYFFYFFYPPFQCIHQHWNFRKGCPIKTKTTAMWIFYFIFLHPLHCFKLYNTLVSEKFTVCKLSRSFGCKTSQNHHSPTSVLNSCLCGYAVFGGTRASRQHSSTLVSSIQGTLLWKVQMHLCKAKLCCLVLNREKMFSDW